MLCLMLLGVFAMSSCVQDDMYELYDDDFESGFMRSKKSKDYGGGSSDGGFLAEYERRKQWVNDPSTRGTSECVAVSIANETGRSIVDVRNQIGPMAVYGTYGVGNTYWEYYYYMAVNEGDGITNIGTAELIAITTSSSEWTNNEWLQYISLHKCPGGRVYPEEGDDFILQINGQHWGILQYIDYDPQPNKSSYVFYIKDQFGDCRGYRNKVSRVFHVNK